MSWPFMLMLCKFRKASNFDFFFFFLSLMTIVLVLCSAFKFLNKLFAFPWINPRQVDNPSGCWFSGPPYGTFPVFLVFLLILIGSIGLPRLLSGKESACNAGDLGLIAGLGRSPGEANGYPFQYSCLKNSMDRRGVWWVTVHGVANSQIQLSG